MKPKLTRRARKLLVRGSKDIKISNKKNKDPRIHFDQLAITRLRNNKFDVTLYWRGIPVLEWTEIPAVLPGESLHICNLTKCSMEFKLL